MFNCMLNLINHDYVVAQMGQNNPSSVLKDCFAKLTICWELYFLCIVYYFYLFLLLSFKTEMLEGGLICEIVKIMILQ